MTMLDRADGGLRFEAALPQIIPVIFRAAWAFDVVAPFIPPRDHIATRAHTGVLHHPRNAFFVFLGIVHKFFETQSMQFGRDTLKLSSLVQLHTANVFT